jgi:hypothetical protein
MILDIQSGRQVAILDLITKLMKRDRSEQTRTVFEKDRVYAHKCSYFFTDPVTTIHFIRYEPILHIVTILFKQISNIITIYR